MIKAIGFDLGGTLIEYKNVPLSWQSLYREALYNVAEQCKIAVDDTLLEKAESILAKYNTRINPREVEFPAEKLFSEILSAWNIGSPKHLDKSIEVFFTYFQRKTEVFGDTIKTLEYLKSKGIKMGILTDVPYGMSKEFVNKDIEKISHLIDCVLTSVEIGFRKPNSAGYEALANKLGVNPEEMIYVGDEEKDIIGAHGTKMKAVYIDKHGRVINEKADYSICNLSCLCL